MPCGKAFVMENSAVKNTEVNTDQVLGLAMDIGKGMVKCGAEINRVEETIVRICHAYELKETDVFSVISMIVTTTFDKSGKDYTQSRRIHSYSTDFGKLEKLNALSRKICEERPNPAEAREELEKINSHKKRLQLSVCIGYILAASGFTVFFGGSAKDAIAAAPIAAILWLISSLSRARGMNKLFLTALSSAISGFLAILFVKIGFANSAPMIMIGDVMVIVPGLMLINSVREMLCGDVMSGLLRFLESIIISLAIACGFAVPLLIFK